MAGVRTVTLESLRSTIVPGNPTKPAPIGSPKVTEDTLARFTPRMVTRVPPDIGPVEGDIPAMTGARAPK